MPLPSSSILQQCDDALLFRRYQAGEDQAFAALVRRHGGRLHAYSRAMLRDEEGARDVIQEAWERLARCRNQAAAVENPLALLMTIVRNLTLNHLRTAARRHLRLDDLTDAQHPTTGEREGSYQEELIVLALERLPLAQREIILLHTYAGYDYVEIARLLDISPDAARMKAMRGRAHLARVMETMMRIEEERIAGEGIDRVALPRTPGAEEVERG